MNPTYKPAGHTSLSPYLIVDGADATITFLKAAFDAVELRRFLRDSGTVMHAEVRIDDTVLMLSDPNPPGWPAVPSHVHLYVPDVDATYRKALAAGGVSVQEPAQKQDADKRGGVRDAGGTTWWIATQVESTTHRHFVGSMPLTTSPVARATMLIRRPAAEVFNAFADPAVTTKFWFSRASGPLTPGATVTWHWDHYGVSAEITVTALEPNRRLVIEWPTPVEWTFTPRGDDATFVSIVASGFTGSDDEQVAQALDSTEGFNLVIAACKALLEHGIDLRLIADKHPADAGAG